MQTFFGQCHCGANRFKVEALVDHLRMCDCSVCRRRGALIFRVAPNAIQFLTSFDNLICYRWGSGTGADYFCSSCGILPFRTPSAPTLAEREAGVLSFSGWAVNARCIDDLDLDALPHVRILGSQITI